MEKLIIIFIAAAFATVALAESVPAVFPKDNADYGTGFISGHPVYPESLAFLGTVNGKSFYSESTKMSWEHGRLYCEGMRFRLASIRSSAELTFLKNANNADYFSGSYWVAGRDALTLRQMTWHYTNDQPDSSYLNLKWVNKTEQHTCLAYVSARITNDDNGAFGLDRCSSTNRVLCESV